MIRKQLLGRDASVRLRHELAILERLRGIEGVAQLVDEQRYPDSIVFEDVGGRSLTGLAKPVAVDKLTGLALALARAVAGMHGRAVIHRDISPANVVVSADGAPCLVDFELAASLSELRSGFALQPGTVGTFAYTAAARGPNLTATPATTPNATETITSDSAVPSPIHPLRAPARGPTRHARHHSRPTSPGFRVWRIAVVCHPTGRRRRQCRPRPPLGWPHK